jgi:hypothetical protein
MKVIPLRHHADVRFAQTLAHQFGLSTASDCVDQLVDQLAAFRREREEQLAALRAEFDRDAAELRAQQAELRAQLLEMDALRRELAMAKAELAVVRALAEWPAHERASLQ